jgi:ribonuclease D
MASIALGTFVWIDKLTDLQNLAAELARYNLLAVDTESNSLHAYREQVCLIQFSTDNGDYLIDPIAIKDLSPLGPIFADPKIEKVFHAAEYDIICLKRDFGFKFENIFDTMHAGRILGRSAVGLGPILEAEFGLILDKRYQRADWGQRPLPPELQDYARHDTHYLIALRNNLYNELQKKARLELAMEDFRRLCNTQPSTPDKNGKSCWHVAGTQHLTPLQATVLTELCSYRETVAERVNKPVFKVLGNHQLLDLAMEAPTTREELTAKCGLNPAIVRRHGDALLQAIQRGMRRQPVQRPASTYPDRQYMRRMDILRRWRKEVAESLGVESDIVLPRDLLEEIALKNPKVGQELEQIMISTPWRFARYGSQLLELLF